MRKMQGQHRMFLFTFTVAVAIRVSLTFNVDLRDPTVYYGNPDDFFGYKVLQFTSGQNKGIIVTAPLKLNGSGEVCQFIRQNKSSCFKTQVISVEKKTMPVKHLGLSIAADFTGNFSVCSPSVAHECDGNTFLNSACFKITNQAGRLKEVSSFTPEFKKCTNKLVDLVFLFDGSGSMTQSEFNKNKHFIKDIMDSLKNTSFRCAAVQFSTDYKKVFDFNDYQHGIALEKLSQEPHMRSLTNTHKALGYVLSDVLESKEAGASPTATKVLVLITDGDPSDYDDNKVIKKYDEKGIIRFVIGVKVNNLDKFTDIATKPSAKYAFKIENYNGLTGILGNFQKQIFKMEGSNVARAGDLTGELAQSGFSSIFYDDTLILGSVGSNNWQGSLQHIHGEKTTQINDPKLMKNSYMGYSVAVGRKNDIPLYFTGAPRYEHKGQVILFDKEFKVAQRLIGNQIGSYFGAELCSVDIDSDSNTDFLLVGAPMFFKPQEKREGQLYVYKVTNQMTLESELNVSAPAMGRFGSTISCLTDLNGDRLQDVAIGAPLEDDNRGAVYIYLGDRHTGIRSTFSQRIVGDTITPGLRFFGQAIDGKIDLGEDGLPDIVIGSQGSAVVLRSRPVFNVITRLSYNPKEISTDNFDCLQKQEEHLHMVTLTACFKMVEVTESKKAKKSVMNITYMLNVDPVRQAHRGYFGTDKKARNLTSTFELKDNELCFNHSINMPKCVIDTLSPISIKFNFSQTSNNMTNAILNQDFRRQDIVEVPFEKQCVKNDSCVADLDVNFNFKTEALLVTENNYFNITVTLSNLGDDSYNTTLTMHYPEGLSFSMMSVYKSTRPTLHNCFDLQGVLDKTLCGISRPVYRSQSMATFIVLFRVLTSYEWKDTMSMTIAGHSDNMNNNSTNSATKTKTIPVKYEIQMAITEDEGTTYLNFTEEDTKPKKMQSIYKITNIGFKAFSPNVSLIFPTSLGHEFEMTNYEVFVMENKTQCSIAGTEINCSLGKSCRIIECQPFILDKNSAVKFILSGDVQFKGLEDHVRNIGFIQKFTGDSGKVKFKSSIEVKYNKESYVMVKSDSSNLKEISVQVEFIISPNRKMIIGTGVVCGFILLFILTFILCQLGCFKRKKFVDEEDEAYPEVSFLQPLDMEDYVKETKDDGQKERGENAIQSAADLLKEEKKELLTNGSTEHADTNEQQE